MLREPDTKSVPYPRGSLGRFAPSLGIALVSLLTLAIPFSFPGEALGWGKKITPKNSSAKTAQKVLALGQKFLSKGKALHEKGKNDLALVELKRAVEADPSLAEAFLLIGEIYTELQIFGKAAEALEAGLPLAELEKLDQGLIGQGYCQLARCHQALGKSDLASGDLVKALCNLPNEAMPRRILGDIHHGKGQFAAAIKAYQEAVRLEPENAGHWWALGQAAIDDKNIKIVQDALNGLTKADPFKAIDFEKLMKDAEIGLEPKKTEPKVSEKKAPPTLPKSETGANTLATTTVRGKPLRPPEKLQKPVKTRQQNSDAAKPAVKIESELEPIIDLGSEKSIDPVAPPQEALKETSGESPVSSEASTAPEGVTSEGAQDVASQNDGQTNQPLIDLVKDSEQERNSSATEPLAPIDDPYAVEPADPDAR